MGSFFDFRNLGDIQPLEGSDGKISTSGNALVARQSSIYSLTFGELQGRFVGVGKDFGSMNMEDLLKNIWTVEENQAFTFAAGVGSGVAPSGNLQRQGSFAFPRTLSQKTVDEVWRDMYKKGTTGRDGGHCAGGSRLGTRLNTLGEMTLEEFLIRAMSNSSLNSTVTAKRKSDIPLVSVDEGGSGGRSSDSLEKAVERRRNRMIKNRESASRSRARKQAYTLELEAEVANLKETNEALLKKQAEYIANEKMHEMMETPWRGKIRGLRRTLTGPW